MSMMMTDDIELMGTMMYKHLYGRGAGHELALKTARVADDSKCRSLASWKLLHPRDMIDMGLSSHEAILVREVLHSDVLPLPPGLHRPPYSSLVHTGIVIAGIACCALLISLK